MYVSSRRDSAGAVRGLTSRLNLAKARAGQTALGRCHSVRVGWLLATNALWRYRLSRGHIDTDSGTTHAGLTVDESLRYIEEVVDDYRRFGGIRRFGGRVAEIGPGDNAGVALLMRRDGCETVDLVDRYRSLADPDQQRRIYQALSERHDLDHLRGGEDWDPDALRGITWHSGCAAEDYFRHPDRQPYDHIVSRAVLEHLVDPLAALRDMALRLQPGGTMVHKVDLRDHECLSRARGDELAWLQVPTWLWRHMTSASGRPNRILMHRYRAVLDGLVDAGRISYRLMVTSLVGVGPVDPQGFADIDVGLRNAALRSVAAGRRRFAPEFRHVSDEDLAVSGILIVAGAPAATPIDAS